VKLHWANLECKRGALQERSSKSEFYESFDNNSEL
jgi:hypothetical protein